MATPTIAPSSSPLAETFSLPDWTVPTRTPVIRKLVARVAAIREVGILTIIALVGYSVAGWWMFYVKHFYINDELSRTADAVYVTIGRDPHLGAIGFYWPPLPQLLDCIFVPIVHLFGATVMAGTLQTAFCMALTIPVLAKIGKSLGVGRWTTFGVCLVFALTPVAIYNSTNGMSEACFFLTGSLTMLGFLRYIQSRSTADTLIFSLSMCAFALTRLEGPSIVLVLSIVAGFEWSCLRSWRSLKQCAWTTLLIGLPAGCCFGFWILVQWILLKNPLFFLEQASGGVVSGSVAWLPNPTEGHWRVVPWAGHWILVLSISLIIALLGIIVRPRSDRTRGSIGILGAMAVILVIQMYEVDYTGGFGDPRYFSMAVPFGAVAVLWLLSRSRATPWNRRPSRVPWAPLWNLGLIGVMIFSAGTGSWTMSSGTTTAIEHECTFFQDGVAGLFPFLGRGGNPKSHSYCTPEQDGTKAYREADAWLDARLTPHDRVLADNSSLFAADLFTSHPKQFIVRNDRDWEKITANPVGKVTYIMTEASRRKGQPEGGSTATTTTNSDYGATIINERPAAWKLVYAAGGAENIENGVSTWIQIYKVTGTAPSAGINGPTGQVAQ